MRWLLFGLAFTSACGLKLPEEVDGPKACGQICAASCANLIEICHLDGTEDDCRASCFDSAKCSTALQMTKDTLDACLNAEGDGRCHDPTAGEEPAECEHIVEQSQ